MSERRENTASIEAIILLLFPNISFNSRSIALCLRDSFFLAPLSLWILKLVALSTNGGGGVAGDMKTYDLKKEDVLFYSFPSDLQHHIASPHLCHKDRRPSNKL